MEKIQDLKYQIQEIGISNNEESENTDEFTSKLAKNTAQFDFVVAYIEKAING